MLCMIVATDKNRVIGREGKIPWRLRRDLVRLRNKTKDRPVILGRKTYDSMAGYYTHSGKQMPGKVYIIVTRNKDYQPAFQNAVVVHSVTSAIKKAKEYQADEIAINGGGSIYRECLPLVDRIYLTEVQTEVTGDATFPELNPSEWHEITRTHHTKDEQNEYDYDFITLERK